MSCSLQIDLLPEIVEAPCILSEVDAALKAKQMKNDVDEYLMVIEQKTPDFSLEDIYIHSDDNDNNKFVGAVEATEFKFPK